MKYEIVETEKGDKIIKRMNEDETISFIPLDESNSDYQKYLADVDSKGTK